MSRLYDALETLGSGSPVPFADIPMDDLPTYLRQVFEDAELIGNSVPPPPGGQPSTDSTLSRADPDPATSAAGMTVSSVRPPPPAPEVKELWEKWGKPLKVSAGSNVLGISVYKMAAHDRHGAWFGRRSIHEGLSFDHWMRAMKKEFKTSLAVEGGPGSGAVRGIGADQLLERKLVKGIGRMEVCLLSAQFPGPTSPRDFVTLLLTTSSDEQTPPIDTTGRTYMLVSIPVDHPQAAPRQGLIRGHYESVEIIREIPLTAHKSQSDSELQHPSEQGSARGRQRANRNPVEWIMITRSDPGGGIPRFMVERGTPGSITQDATKFVDWACGLKEEDLPEPVSDDEEMETEALVEREVDGGVPLKENAEVERPAKEDHTDETPSDERGILSSISSQIEGSLAQLTPHAQKFLFPNVDEDSSDTDSTSLESFASAEQWTTANEQRQSSLAQALEEGDLGGSQRSSLGSTPPEGTHNPTDEADKEEARLRLKHAKELEKLEQKRKEIDAKRLSSESQLRDPPADHPGKAKEAAEKEAKELARAQERHDREVAKQAAKHEQQLAKLQQKRERERTKREERRKKEAEKGEGKRIRRDRDQWKRLCELVKRENEILKAQVEELQRENTRMVTVLGRSEEGKETLKRMRAEGWGALDGKRNGGREGGSMKSGKSGKLGSEKSKDSSKD
ncbi:hypothetical protein P152DRAFT_428733 [Eremomyces bilateralis CBS 781.70]|uniref:DUF3074 domain-containing protein n=1 Tax=Eremomyces bilateralis CBS 781.70 TaxID=1392243 RepID=A0A6G1GF94_9PEZI|nr:uncharacterized protein P152DRAFT_428733 [Eremomyces bilateralis CBS 781.70]KAF1816549.1 hypothetical protein P152DRAFT_428733 [Eremomyces bilateralis CBS 781.70]